MNRVNARDGGKTWKTKAQNIERRAIIFGRIRVNLHY